MTAITIGRFNARYRVSPGAPTAPRRLAQILTDTLTRGLDQVVDKTGIGPSGYLCIRDVTARATLALDEPDDILVERLGQAIADAISGATAGGAAAVYYPSRGPALIDLATRALNGDFTRSWAWAQLGVWPSDSPVRADVVAALVMRALARDPRCAVSTLVYLARTAEATFAALLERAAPETWVALAQAVTRGAGWTLQVTALPTESQPPASVPLVRRILDGSGIASQVTAHHQSLPIPTCLALGALAVLEVEPAAWAGGAGQVGATVAAVARELWTTRERTSVRRLDSQRRANAERAESPRGRTASASGERLRIGAGASGESVVEPTASPGREIGARPEVAAPHAAEAGHVVRWRATTESGGVLYLIGLAGRLGLPEMILNDARLSAGGLRWALNQLAAALAGIEPGDPAALAFAGLLPVALPPTAERPAANTSELGAIREYRAVLVEGLIAALDRRDEPEAQLLEFVCRRRAEIVGDPGWIEARFSLDDVSVDIRRAGLDRDPDWVQWLGVVVRFVYA